MGAVVGGGERWRAVQHVLMVCVLNGGAACVSKLHIERPYLSETKKKKTIPRKSTLFLGPVIDWENSHHTLSRFLTVQENRFYEIYSAKSKRLVKIYFAQLHISR